MTRRVLWAGVLALLLLGGPGAAAVSRALPASQAVGSIPPFVWTLTVFPGVEAIAEPLYTVQFLPDGLMPAGGPKTVLAMEKIIGVDTSKVTLGNTFTNEYAQAVLTKLGITPTTTPAGPNG